METLTPQQAIKRIQKETGVTQAEIAERTEFRDQKAISKFIQCHMKVSVFEDMISCMGYELIIRPVGCRDEKEFIKIEDEYVKRGSKVVKSV